MSGLCYYLSTMLDTTPNPFDSNNSIVKPLEGVLNYFNERSSLRGLVRSTHPISGRRMTRLGPDCEDGMRVNERHLETSYNLSEN